MKNQSHIKLEKERKKFEKHLMVNELLDYAVRWQRNYCHLIRDLADAFGEEEVLDTVEKIWWDMGYECGLAWRKKFEKNPKQAMHKKAMSWHGDPLWARICCCDVELKNDRWELRAVKCFREVFNEMKEQKIGISLCMTDFAAVRGWSPKVVMRQPKHLLKGDNYCYQIRYISDDPSEQWNYSKELSEKVGWRSVDKLLTER